MARQARASLPMLATRMSTTPILEYCNVVVFWGHCKVEACIKLRQCWSDGHRSKSRSDNSSHSIALIYPRCADLHTVLAMLCLEIKRVVE